MIKNKHGIEICCANCRFWVSEKRTCKLKHITLTPCSSLFEPTKNALEVRITELLQKIEEIKDGNIAKLIKPLKWEEFPSSLCAKINGVRLFLREESGGFDFDVMGVYSERISLCDNIEYAKQYAQNWLVNLVKSACGLESGVQK